MFYFDNIEGKKVLKSNILPELQHFFTTRECPVKGNEKFFKTALKVKRIVSPVQTHSANIEIVDGRNDYPDTDGLILTEHNTAVYLSFADCTPLILYDRANHIGAVAHAGWRGTAARIGIAAIERMNKSFNTTPENITAIIGPAISICCYEVGDDVLSALKNTVKDTCGLFDGHRADLKKINARQLSEAGVKNIDICPYCTSCNNNLFYSYRKENRTNLRHNAVIIL